MGRERREGGLYTCVAGRLNCAAGRTDRRVVGAEVEVNAATGGLKGDFWSRTFCRFML